jgi:hypothetical protein
MKHIEVILVPILMFSDYFLTVLGAVLKEKKYSDHFKTQYYELNPALQKQIGLKKWVNPRHIALTLITSGILAFLVEFSGMPESISQGIFGCLFVFFGIIIGRHLSNIIIFRYLAANPAEISGQITMSHSLVLFMSTYQYLVVAVPMIFLAVFSPTPFVLGGLAGSGLVFAVHSQWIQLHRKNIKASNKAGEDGDKK